jgi:hypothetical protein
MPKVIKITEADLRKIITEKLDEEVNEDGIIGALLRRATSAVTKKGPKGFSTTIDKAAMKSGYVSVISTMRRDVASLLAKVPTLKISPNTVKMLSEPRYNARVAYDTINELGTEGTKGSIRGEYSGIEYSLRKAQAEFAKPAGQQMNIKEMMENLYHAKDELSQDIIKRPSLAKDVPRIQSALNRLNTSITQIENLFKTPEKPSSYLVKEGPKL